MEPYILEQENYPTDGDTAHIIDPNQVDDNNHHGQTNSESGRYDYRAPTNYDNVIK